MLQKKPSRKTPAFGLKEIQLEKSSDVFHADPAVLFERRSNYTSPENSRMSPEKGNIFPKEGIVIIFRGQAVSFVGRVTGQYEPLLVINGV